jgi:hypothetical protein
MALTWHFSSDERGFDVEQRILNLEGLRVARRLLDRYEELWRERIERMDQLISEPRKEADR